MRFRYFEIIGLIFSFEYPSYFFDFLVSSASIKYAVFLVQPKTRLFAFIHI